MLTVEDINVYYGAIHAIKGISLDVPDGEIVALIGSNGAGKSTTLRTISGLMKPKTGKILYEGHDIAGVPAHKIVGMGLCQVPEGRHVFANMTVLENMTYAPRVVNGLSKQEAKEKAMKLLAKVNLSDKANEYPSRLSGGQKQRLAIARVFLKNPPVVVLDEATSALDNITEQQIQKELDELAVGRTTLIIAHRLSTIRHADKIVVLDEGAVAECGSHEELLARKGRYYDLYQKE